MSELRFFKLCDPAMSNYNPNSTGIHRHYYNGRLSQVKMHVESRVDLNLKPGDMLYMYVATITSALNYNARFLVTGYKRYVSRDMVLWEYDLESIGPLNGQAATWTVYFEEMSMMEIPTPEIGA